MKEQAKQLEQAILERAERLAAEFRDRAKRSRDTILRQGAEKLRLREQREEGIARALGERTYRQQVQARELKMQSQLDRVRWNLVQNVEHRLADAMRDAMADDDTYLPTLIAFVAAAADVIERSVLVVSANATDRQLLESNWAAVEAAVAERSAGKSVSLSVDAIDTLGGVLVTSDDGLVRVDQTFEGRLERLRPRIQQTILERLLPSGFDTATLFSG